MGPIAGQVTLGVYAALLAVGGVMGYVKAKSRPSLIAGLASAAVAAALLAASFPAPGGAFLGGIALAVALAVLFAGRYGKTRKFMPSGLMLLVSVVVALLLVAVRFFGTL